MSPRRWIWRYLTLLKRKKNKQTPPPKQSKLPSVEQSKHSFGFSEWLQASLCVGMTLERKRDRCTLNIPAPHFWQVQVSEWLLLCPMVLVWLCKHRNEIHWFPFLMSQKCQFLTEYSYSPYLKPTAKPFISLSERDSSPLTLIWMSSSAFKCKLFWQLK